MVKTCSWGTCNSDSRFPERIVDVRFIPFPKPKTNWEKCARWVKACGRPHSQLNVTNIDRHKFVCSKHFVKPDGPTEEYPDPVPADGSKVKKSRPHWRQRSPLSVLSVAAELTDLQQRLVACKEQLHQQKILNEHLLAENESLKKISAHTSSDFLPLSVDMILKQDTEDKKLFEYYSSLKYDTFVKLLQFLTAEDTPKIQRKRKDILSMTNENQLLLTLIRLRHNFGLKDLAFRFCISQQAVSEIFNAWIDHMFLLLGTIPIWPHHDSNKFM
ncbi:hypothetical protein KUTeg_022243 [Tegillarca granosa]|uniref:THAP-type domain-containing protein n=1 Tax=Tegillarca granosa TaxID=220873 RepID=A0ABQ9E5N2_TEGGR|nr:hypothetical protein KUTeg_022243 [Tegillarca granosa]